jgi:maltose-binding protein MalE
MYHYVVIKKVIFFIAVSFSLLIIVEVEALSSPRERWNYQKSKDTINHHTVKLKVRPRGDRSKLNKYDDTKKVEYLEEEMYVEVVERKTKPKVYRPGSPRDRW